MPRAQEVTAYQFWVYPKAGEEPDCIVLAPSPEHAAAELGGKLGERSNDGGWDVVFDKELFQPPHSTEDAKLNYNAWYFQMGEGYPRVLLSVEEGEESVVSLLKATPVIMTSGVTVTMISGRSS